MENIGLCAEVSQKIRSAIKAKLMEIGVYVDEELPDYVMVMVANKRSKDQMDEELQLFLGKHTSIFTSWLHQVLQKLQEVTVANLVGIKRKSSEDSKKKKKSKQIINKNETRKKIKVEPEDESKKDNSIKTKGDNKDEKDQTREEDNDSVHSVIHEETKKSEKNLLRTEKDQMKGLKSIPNCIKQVDQCLQSDVNEATSVEEDKGTRSKSYSTPSQAEDLDDEDCINIRTDGELLDTAEEVNLHEPSKQSKGKEDSASLKNSVKEPSENNKKLCQSLTKKKNKLRSKDYNSTAVNKETVNEPLLPQCSSPKRDKVVDARVLLNQKKAAKRTRTRSRDRSTSPFQKRRDSNKDVKVKNSHENRDVNRRINQNEEKESSSQRLIQDDEKESNRTLRNMERNQRGSNDRGTDTLKRRGDDEYVQRTNLNRTVSRDKRRRDSSHDSVTTRVFLDRPFRHKNDNWDSTRSSKTAACVSEEPHKRSTLGSRVVARAQEPEENVGTPVPSVVKVTPRPRRPPSQQPSTTLIMKAISEANKSLANMPQRPDSTQRARKEQLFTQKLRQIERIPPEKIAVSITNPIALQNAHLHETEADFNDPFLSKNYGSARNRSPPPEKMEITSSEPDAEDNKTNKVTDWNNEEKVHESNTQKIKESANERAPTQDVEANEEPIDEMSDPQFVVTLNGYDPDGLYCQSEVDLGEEADGDSWIKENVDEYPLLTSTPDEVQAPHLKKERCTSPIVIMNTPAVNHSNLIEVEIVKTKSTERCKYWPACRMTDKCTYYHPTKPCKMFPACKFGDACLYIHPQCKFNALCTRKACVFAHTPVHTPLQPAVVPKIKALYAANAPQPCKFYPKCTNINCQFTHPLRSCRFGLYCTKKDCSFDHGHPPLDKLKWTREPTT